MFFETEISWCCNISGSLKEFSPKISSVWVSKRSYFGNLEQLNEPLFGYACLVDSDKQFDI
jgi:hypothetical protein